MKEENVFYIIGKIILLPLIFTGFFINREGAVILKLLPECTFKHYLGVPCPACGVSRAAYQLSEGHIIESIRYNPIVLISLIIYLLFMAGMLIKKHWGEKKHIKINIEKIVYLWLAIIMVQWVIRILDFGVLKINLFYF